MHRKGNIEMPPKPHNQWFDGRTARPIYARAFFAKSERVALASEAGLNNRNHRSFNLA